MLSRRLLLSLPAAVFAQTPVALHPGMRLSYIGLGPLRIGMTERQIRAAVTGPFEIQMGPGEDCYHMNPKVDSAFGSPPGLMMLEDRLARIDIWSGPWKTVSGASVGSSEAEIERLYPGQVKRDRHPYDDTGHYLIVTPKDAAYKRYNLIFETDGKLVTSFRAGLPDATRLIEGCS